MVSGMESLTTKVGNECLQRNLKFGILDHVTYKEVPPRVEYIVIPFGTNFFRILVKLEKLRRQIQDEI